MLTQPAGGDHTLKDYSSSKMIKIMLRASTTLVVGWILLFIGVNSVNISAVDATTESTDASTPHSLTSVIMDLRITNRVYNESLADQQSAEYTTLKQELDQLFDDIYALSYNSTHLMYLGTDEMIFSNGSVIATSRLLFGPTHVSPELVRGIFLPAYKQIPSPSLDIDFSYTDNELPTEGPFEEEKNFSSPTMTTYKDPPLSTTPLMTTPLTSHSPSTHTPNMSTSIGVENITHSIHSTSTLFNSTTVHPTPNVLSNTSTLYSTTAETPAGSITTASNGTTITTVPNVSTVPTTTGTTTPAASTSTITSVRTTLTSVHSTAVNPTTSSTPFTTSSTPFSTASPQKTTPMYYSPPTIADLVPGWAVALLALVGVSLFLLILLIILVVIWCCCPKRRVFVNEPEEMNPPMYFSPDIPMYSTQSTFDTTNGKQADVREKTPKIRTGMYVVNK
ncbi:mucin-5AC [Danio aesculapii]|uniref:mucin-5AC n=1 Tax=Danio aesculapii TaxID=1142201 RepID=UPI0024BF9836|nr:mucin-5AC [Danio aesculapii]